MHFPHELVDVSEFKAPTKTSATKSEIRMAEQLIESMTSKWQPEEYTDDYREALEKLIEEKIEHGDKAAPAPSMKKRPSNVVDLVSVLKESIKETQARGRFGQEMSGKQAKSKKTRRHKKAA
jgi:DNA end-binding protein Ku